MSKKINPIRNGLNIIIVGCGKVGLTLIEQLSKEGHDITIIDSNPEVIQEATGMYDIMGIVGNGASYSVQMEAGIENTDLIIAVTESDELNLLCCTVAKRVGNCAAIARVRTPDYSKEAGYLREKLGLTMIINPELETAKEMAHILYLPTALDINSFAHGQAEIIKFKIPEDNVLDGITIASLNKMTPYQVLVCAVVREEKVYIPSGNFQMRAGDIISFVAPRTQIRSFLKTIGVKTKKVKNTIIIGGGRAAYYLATQLLRMGVNVKIIERDKARCEYLSTLLPDAIIINGDGTDPELLKEEGLNWAESFIPLTGMDEENIMLTLHARKFSDAKVITKINRMTFKDVLGELDLGSIIYPRLITSEAIIAYVRARYNGKDSNIETLYHLFDGQAEAIEFRIDEESEITNIPLMDLELKSELLIACISRNGQILLPTGQDCIRVGDTVVIVTTHSGFTNILDILR